MESKRHIVITTKENNIFLAKVKNMENVIASGRNEQELKNNIIESIDAFYSPHVYQLKITYQNI